MRKVLFVGQHPFGGTGNGNMLHALLNRLDESKFKATLFVDHPQKLPEWDGETPWPWPIISAQEGDDDWGHHKLANLINSSDFDVVFFVGIDIWRYSPIYDTLHQIRKRRPIKYICLCPYDLQDNPATREDWIGWFGFFDLPMVYSQYGYDALKESVPNIQYFRPPMYRYDMFVPMDKEQCRKKFFPQLTMGHKLIGFIGANQFRKDPQKLIKAFATLYRSDPSLRLYMHCDLGHIMNLTQVIGDSNVGNGVVYSKNTSRRYTISEVAGLYNACDVVVNCSMQEGLSWTILEAFLTRTPVIATDTTAQGDLLHHLPSNQKVPVNQETYLPLFGNHGPAFLDAKACSWKDLMLSIKSFFIQNSNPSLLPHDVDVLDACQNLAMDYVQNPSDVNQALLDAVKKKKAKLREDAILFVQHSSAGDVLMSTQCLLGIRKKHPGKKLIYMTQEKFKDIVEGNPLIDEIIDWDESKTLLYRYVYNPHGEHILPGGFNNLDETLYSMYPFFCDVDPDSMFIQTKKPDIDLPEKFVVVQTAGQDKAHRTYKNMALVVKGLELPVFQIGALNDMYCEGAIDLRGELSYRESAYVLSFAKGAVLIDSFPSHLAGCLGTPAVVLYGPAPARVTRPRDDHGSIVNIEPHRLKVCPITSNCWGKAGCQTPCINSINPMFVRQHLDKILQSGG